ncbi:DNase I-like protein [Cystobasidium minutum MCA 4210]|uniref:DNase I-like protein n=1 Tax=Cystobasidium minutum MCA 4210 TaxID=1397322 RepID=UPI0034CFE67A|eukprot:jgi/Rhomi1/146646/e_gw1.6.289.1
MLLLYRQTHPATALILAGDKYTLTFKRPSSTNASSSSSSSSNNTSPQIELSFDPISEFDVLGCSLLCQVHSSLGLVQLASSPSATASSSSSSGSDNDIFLAVIAHAQSLTSRYNPEEQVSRIQAVEFYSVSSTTWDDWHGGAAGVPPTASSSGLDLDHNNYALHGGSASNYSTAFAHPATAMRKILSNGHFYFSSGNYDISTRLEERLRRRDESTPSSDAASAHSDKYPNYNDDSDGPYDSRFVWNSFLMDSLLSFRSNLEPSEKKEFDNAAFIVTIIQGFVGVSDFTLSGNPVTLSLVSRLGSARAGTRFNARGIDDDGNVANFVETETIFRTRDSVFSFVQVRGSVPLFWEQQQGTPFGGQKVQITRPPIASQPAFNKHFTALLAAYPHIEVVNLLSSKDHESLLSNAYREHVRNANAQLDDGEIEYVEFDFHSKVKLAGGIESVRDNIRRDPETGGRIDEFGYCLANVSHSKVFESLIARQEGVFRVNCLDCLDRTNVVQDILSRLTLEQYLHNLVPSWSNSEILLSAHRTLWAENGDALSRIYAGTGALNTSFTRSGKRTFAGALSDATKSVSRMYISNFVDKGKQMAIDALLGNLAGQQKVVVVDPIRDSVESALRHRESEYSSKTSCAIFCGTFNVNGKSPGQESYLPWLFPDTGYEPDIIALGFQELVELSPQQIMATDPEKLKRWEAFITKEIASRPKAKSTYVLLRSEQLVGTCLIVFMKNEIANNIRNVEAATKKTGLRGMAGNKGAVAIRLDYCDTSFCFVTAHFAAGHSNYEQRNMDYATIANGLHFRRGRKIAAHDNVLYFGDLNYRIQLPNDQVRYMASIDDYAGLIEGDQLTKCMKQQIVFAGYNEGPLVFRPTYKYDNNSETYDSSEKQRIPSWTDRVLYKGEALGMFKYNRAELMTSDHRPVYALFRAKVNVVDHAKKAAIAKELLLELAPEKARTQSIMRGALVDLMDEESEDLPGPSSESQAWWDPLDIATIQQKMEEGQNHRNVKITNPFDADYLSTPQRGSELSAATGANPNRSLSIKRKPPPTDPSSKSSTATSSSAKPPVNTLTKPTSTISKSGSTSSMPASASLKKDTSLLDVQDEEMKRPALKIRETTNEWQVITPSPMKR